MEHPTIEEMIHTTIKSADKLFSEGYIDQALEEYNSLQSRVEQSTINNTKKALFFAHYGKLLVNNIFLNSYPVSRAINVLEIARTYSDNERDSKTCSLITDQLGLASYYDNLGKEEPSYIKAEEFFDEAFEIRNKLDDTRLVSETMFHLALIYERTDRLEKAFEYYQEAYNLAKQAGAKLEQSFAVRHIGFLHRRNEDIDKGILCLEESLALRIEVGYRVALPFSHASLGDAFFANKQLDDAIAQYEKGYEVAKMISNKRGIMLNAYSMGRTLTSMHQFDEALNLLQEAKTLAIEINHEVAINLIDKQLAVIEESSI